jgi:hypothetical protein
VSIVSANEGSTAIEITARIFQDFISSHLFSGLCGIAEREIEGKRILLRQRFCSAL